MSCGRIAGSFNRIISLVTSITIFAVLVSSHQIHNTDTRRSVVSYNTPKQLQIDPASDSQIQNATLGFEKIIVLNDIKHMSDRAGIFDAATMSNITIEFQDDTPDDTSSSTPSTESSPPQELRRSIQERSSSWTHRTTHVRAIRQMLSQHITSALFIEAEADWDVTIHTQLSSFAAAARTTLHSYLSGTHMRTAQSPYGADWDVLWLGHCGGTSPPPSLRPHQSLIADDASMPPAFVATGFCPAASDADLDEKSCSAPRQRIVEIGAAPNCTAAYALSARGAAKLLLLLDDGFVASDSEFRAALMGFCAKTGVCLSVSPPYFVRHKGKGRTRGDAEEGEPGFESGYRDVGVSKGLLHSARMAKMSEGVSQYVEDRWGWRYKRASEYPGAKSKVEDFVDRGHVWQGRMRAKSAKFVAEEI